MHAATVLLCLGWCAAMTMLGGLLHDRMGGDAIALIIVLTAVAATVLSVAVGRGHVIRSARAGRVFLVLGVLVLGALGVALARIPGEAPLILTTGAAMVCACLGIGLATRPRRPRATIVLYWATNLLVPAGMAAALDRWGPIIVSVFTVLLVQFLLRHFPAQPKGPSEPQ